MTAHLNIGPTPSDVPCAQLGTPEYAELSALECGNFINQIRRYYPEPAGARICAKKFSHDFGTYTEVIVQYDETNDEAVEYAFDVEADVKARLDTWDEEATKELTARNYFSRLNGQKKELL